MSNACVQWIRNGQALHLQHGPIDIVVECSGCPMACEAAYQIIHSEFDGILRELVAELPLLRTPMHCYKTVEPEGIVARKMFNACLPFSNQFITPMAAVAGAVADHLVDTVRHIRGLAKVWVNNGGDIAFYVGPGQIFKCGIVPDINSAAIESVLSLTDQSGAGGVASSGQATKGQGGRSFSMGIADVVSVVADCAATADVAATLIANHVDLKGQSNIDRCPANKLDPDSDLGGRMVVTHVGSLSEKDIKRALKNGACYATELLGQRVIKGAYLSLCGRSRILVTDSNLGSAALRPVDTSIFAPIKTRISL